MDALPNEEILYKIADFWFVRSALQGLHIKKELSFYGELTQSSILSLKKLASTL